MRAFCADFGINLRTLVRFEKGGGNYQPSTYRDMERVLREARARLAESSGNTVAEPAPPPPGPDHGPTPAKVRKWGLDSEVELPAHMERLELLLLEFSAWARRSTLQDPRIMDRLPGLVRKLINTIEEGEGESKGDADQERQLAS